MVISYFIVFWLMFYSGLFYYPESQKWIGDVILLSFISGILVTIVSAFAVRSVNELMNDNPHNGGYLLATLAASVLIVTLLVFNISRNVLHYYILMSPSLVGVFIYIIYPAIFFTFVFRANKHL